MNPLMINEVEKLQSSLQQILQKNVHNISGQYYFSAGSTHFTSFWTRDFCYSVPGLLVSGFKNEVKSHLLELHKLISPEGHLPRILETRSSAFRIMSHLFLPRSIAAHLTAHKDKVFAEYKGEHNTLAFDSNVLFVKAVLSYQAFTGESLLEGSIINNYLKAYKPYFKGLWIVQEAFSDWQDSRKREGVYALLNFQYWQCCKLTEETSPEGLPFTKQDFYTEFYCENTGLFKDTSNKLHYSADLQLALLEDSMFLSLSEKADLYESYKKHFKNHDGLLDGLCGLKRDREISWTCKLVGLSSYHSHMRWAWLWGWSLKVAALMGDVEMVHGVTKALLKKIEEDQTVYEIFDKKTDHFFKSLLYRSERDFSWGASFICDAMNVVLTNQVDGIV